MSDTSRFRNSSAMGFLLAFLVFVSISFLSGPYVINNYPLGQRIAVQIKSDKKILIEVYYDIGEGYRETHKVSGWIEAGKDFQTVELKLPIRHLRSFRIDPLTEPGTVYIKSIELSDLLGRQRLWSAADILKDFRPQHDIGRFEFSDGAILVESTGNDPYFLASALNVPKLSIGSKTWLFAILIIVSAILSLVFGGFFSVCIRKFSINSMGNILSAASRSITNLLNLRPIQYSIAVLPLGIFFWFFFRYSVNIPHWDDYDAILGPLMTFSELGNAKEKIALIFAQHNEHRVAFDRVIALLTFYLNGSIDFRLLMFIGNMGLVGLLLVLYKSSRVVEDRFLYFIPVIYLLFQPQYWENIYWGMAAIANFYVLFFAFLSLYLVTKQSQKSFILATAFAILATFTSGGGMVVFFVGLTILIYQKRFKNFLTWLAVMSLTLFSYFHGYVKPAHHPSIFNAIVKQPSNTLDYFFSFMGSSLFLPHQAGLLPLAALIYLTKRKYYEKNLAIYSFLVFLLITAGAVALTRSGFGVEQAYSSRYMIISILFFILLYISLIETIDKERWLKRYYPLIFVLSLVFNIASYCGNYKHIIGHREYLTLGLLRWQLNMGGLSYPDPVRANNVMKKLIQQNIYYVPSLDFNEISSRPKNFPLPPETGNITFAFDPVENNSFVAVDGGWAYINGQSSEGSEIFIVLKSERKTYIFDTFKQKRPDVTAYFKTLNFDDSGFSTIILKNGLESGSYRIGFYITKGTIEALQYTNRTIRKD